jgi:hypothetical protein
MKRALSILGLASFLVFSVQPVWANSCPKLIKEAKGLLADTKLGKGDQNKVKALIDEAQKLHDSGSHGDSVKKAKEALALLGKK